ncbi:MAG TPA: hypothetical protein PKX99_03435 [Thermoanaerobaculia bacterium]|nr:hypothetical protein [Thermoanaerobaculia bacterium]
MTDDAPDSRPPLSRREVVATGLAALEAKTASIRRQALFFRNWERA